MQEKILSTLRALRTYAISRGLVASFDYHQEESYLMRFANSAISLNTNEKLVRLHITVYQGNKRATYAMITDLNNLDEMKIGVDKAAEMVEYVMPLSYTPSVPELVEDYVDVRGFDADLANMSGEEKLAFFNLATKDLESDHITLSGIFSSGTNIHAQISTPSGFTQFFKTSDAQVTIVLAHNLLKWEVIAEQSAYRKADLIAAELHQELRYLVDRYQHEPAQQIPVGKYDIVFGAAAVAEMLNMMSWIGFSGGSYKRGYSFTDSEDIGKRIFSDKFTLVDNPNRLETFPFSRDMMGIPRNKFPLFTNGVFQGFTWYQDDADEFGEKPSGHNIPHISLELEAGDMAVGSLAELAAMPRKRDILYIPYLHYMNIVNPSKALVTATSRFGALLLRKDGLIVVPFNVRLTQSMLDVFGDRLAWLSQKQTVYNTSLSYGPRNPEAIVLPKFIMVKDLEISHSNTSY